MPIGRPTKYRDSMPETVVELMSQGASLVEVAAELGIDKATLHRWAGDEEGKPDFCASIKRGVELSEAWWMREGRLALRDREFNHGLWYMNMKNRFGWTDRKEVSGSNGGAIVIHLDGALSDV